MKNKPLNLMVFILFTLNCYSQNIDLYSMIGGKIENFKNINDYKTNELLGYIILSKLDKVSDDYTKYEYTYLDKNLNKVFSNEFDSENSVKNYKINVLSRDEVELIASLENYNDSDKRLTITNKKINLRKNTISSYIPFPCSYKYQIKDCNKFAAEMHNNSNNLKKEIGYNRFNTYLERNEEFSIILEDSRWDKKYRSKDAIVCFDKNQNEKWRYEFNREIKQEGIYEIELLDSDNESLYLLKYNKLDDKKAPPKIIFINKTSGMTKEILLSETKNEVFNINPNIKNYPYSKYSVKKYDDRIIIVNNIMDVYSNDIGYFRLIIDKVKNNVTEKKLYFENDFSIFKSKIKKDGKVENGYKITLRDVVYKNTDELDLIFEKQKGEKQTIQRNITSDLVYISTDSNFKINNYKNIDKEKSRNNDTEYLFHRINKKGEISFFYYDYLKQNKKWILYINYIIGNDIKQEAIEVESENKENFIFPYFAKDGYVLLYEYNEKNKYSQVRLEKLNY